MYAAFDLAEVHSRMFAHISKVTVRNDTLGSYRGQLVPEAVRATRAVARESTG